jgi:hypothetical protein
MMITAIIIQIASIAGIIAVETAGAATAWCGVGLAVSVIGIGICAV